MLPLEKNQIIEQELARVRVEMPCLESAPLDVQRVLCCLREHLFEETCNVNAIVESCGVSTSDIHARFKYHTGMTIRRYLEKWRMEAARRLIQHDALEVGLVAFSVGYASHRTFNRAFLRCAGCTPTAYREKMSKQNV